MNHEDNLIYVICKGTDENYYIEDKENSRVYKFQNYDDIRDKNPDPKRFKLHNLETVIELPHLAEKVEIYERINNRPLINSYSWKSNRIVGEGSFPQVNMDILKAFGPRWNGINVND